jgi:hypothetical protein
LILPQETTASSSPATPIILILIRSLWLDFVGFGWIWLLGAKKSGFTWFYPERAGNRKHET